MLYSLARIVSQTPSIISTICFYPSSFAGSEALPFKDTMMDWALDRRCTPSIPRNRTVPFPTLSRPLRELNKIMNLVFLCRFYEHLRKLRNRTSLMQWMRKFVFLCSYYSILFTACQVGTEKLFSEEAFSSASVRGIATNVLLLLTHTVPCVIFSFSSPWTANNRFARWLFPTLNSLFSANDYREPSITRYYMVMCMGLEPTSSTLKGWWLCLFV